MNLFTHRGHYLLVVDYRSRYPEVTYMRSTNFEAVINAVKSILVHFGILEVNKATMTAVRFTCIRYFCETLWLPTHHSSPNYRQSNGEVERMVRTVNELLEKADDPFLALLSYTDTAGVTGFRPAQLLMGRSL